MGKKSKTAAVLTGVAAVGAATAAIIASQKKKGENGEVKDFNLDEKFVDFKNRVEDLMITVDNATADSREDIKVTLVSPVFLPQFPRLHSAHPAGRSLRLSASVRRGSFPRWNRRPDLPSGFPARTSFLPAR